MDEATPEAGEAGDPVTDTEDAGGGGDSRLSVGLPIEFSQPAGLTDDSTVTVTSEGYSPGAQVGVVMCYGPIVQVDEPNPEPILANCDLSDYALTGADESGAIAVDFNVSRYVTSQHGTGDCADPGPEFYCSIAAGDLSDITNFGLSEVRFATLAGGTPPPVIDLSKSADRWKQSSS